VELDLATFKPTQPPVVLPAPSPANAGRLSLNQGGQILFGPIFSDSGNAEAGCRAWFWNGQAGVELNCPFRWEPAHETEVAGTEQVTEHDQGAALSRDGKHLFWFANQSRQTGRQGEEGPISVSTTFGLWQTDLGGGNIEQLGSIRFPKCKCTTGACEETCPEGVFWAPDTGVDDFFLVTSFVVGQLQSQSLASFLYRRTQGQWSSQQLSAPLDDTADAAATGDILIEAVPDFACCGWENESDDTTLLERDGKTIVLFDENVRYHNADYDVNFSAEYARLSPNRNMVAMTIMASATPGSSIRLSADGKENPTELAAIQRALADLPAVEVVGAGDPVSRVAFVPHALLIGWLNDNQILVIQDQLLATYDLPTGILKKSGVRVADSNHVFLR
jgi:hypothetical protein